MVYVNAKIREPRTGPESFDVVKFAETYFNLEKPCLIVREKAQVWHWHVNGTLKADETWERARSHPHPDCLGTKDRPISGTQYTTDESFELSWQYCIKRDPELCVQL